ncbi:efflux transporter outer membrane subunit [Cerasicoccus frondis]|uniref:efflux transporter outer membrane subunit n=1 Tax=Cerasicoccus frondis TaxID=490090 RepID=UPI002852CA0E|nr:efflux transporter outer membrane subunit [Cerasicoccus frondis]
MPTAFSDTGSVVIPDNWWTAFGDEALNDRMERALSFNLSLEAVWLRLMEAQAVITRESASLYPSVDAFFEGAAGSGSGGSSSFQEFGAGLNASYEVDLWGRIRSLVDAERFRAEATFYDYQTAALTLTAQVAVTYYQLVEAQNQRDLLLEQIKVNEQVYGSLKARFSSGLIRSADLIRQQQLIEATREQVIVVEARIGVLENALAVLEGKPPEVGEPVADERLPELPPMPSTGVPAALVQRRPDVQAAYFVVKAANADLAAAITNQYPRLSLDAAIFTVGETPSDLFGSWIRSIAGQIVAPVFDAGRRAAEVDRNQALQQRRVMEYGQVVLDAFQEVEDALVREQKQVERIASIEEQLRLARMSYQRLQIEYFNGVTEYLDVLTALIEEQRLQRQLLEGRRTLIEFRIALYRALAGSIETDREVVAALIQETEDEEYATWLSRQRPGNPTRNQ